MRYVVAGLAALGLGLLAVWLARVPGRREQWTLLTGWET